MMNLGKQTSMRRCPAGRRAGSLLAGLVLLAGLAPVLSAQTASGVAGKPWFQAAPGPAYQVLVYSFADSNGDGWGDLNGLTARLDYLNDGQPGSGKSLGVSALWLSPIHPAASYHGYDVTDYLGVDPRLGTLADFDRLVAEAHKRGIRIVLDLVFNHSSDSHPWFKAMLKDPAGTYGAYYVKKDPKVSYGQGGMGTWCTRRDAKGDPVNYFAAFWEGMPDLNADNPAVLAEFKNILKFWLGHGVDGFRFDAAKHVFDTNELPQGSSSLARNKAFWADLRSYARGIKPNVWFLGEVISDAATELRAYGASLDSLFDFASAKSLLGNSNSTSIIGLDGRESGIAKVLVANYGQFARADGFVPAPILSNHDQDRAMTVNLNLAGASGVYGWGAEAGDSPAIQAAKRQGLNRTRLMGAMVQTVGGLPFIYYGEELGMTGRRYQNDDISRRDAFPWGGWAPAGAASAADTNWQKASSRLEPGSNRATPAVAAQDADASSPLNLYRRLAELRRTHPTLHASTTGAVAWPGFNQGAVVSWTRGTGAGQVLVAHNLGDSDQGLSLPAGVAARLVFDSGAVLAGGFRTPEPTAASTPAGGQITVPAVSTRVWALLAP